MIPTNPIQQRIELLADKWIDALSKKDHNVVIIRTPENEQDMAEAFFDYMLAIDTPIDDIAIQFQTPLNNPETFSRELLEELHYTIHLWNNTDKQKGIEAFDIDWFPDYEMQQGKNKAELFVSNIRSLAKELVVIQEESIRLVPIIFFNSSLEGQKLKWVKQALQLDMKKNITLLINDTYENPTFQELIFDFPDQAILIEPHFNMPAAMEQLAAMGDPKAPETQYRHAYMKLTNAIVARKEKDVQHWAGECIGIAKENTVKDTYWIPQIVTVHFTLAAYYIGDKAYKKAINAAENALEVAQSSLDKVNDEMAYRNIGQCYMLIASLHIPECNWDKAHKGYNDAAKNYTVVQDHIMQIEALRMAAYCAKKQWDSKSAIQYLTEAIRLGKHLTPDTAEASSYALAAIALLKLNYQTVIDDNELEQLMRPLWGEGWRTEIYQFASLETTDK